MSKVISEADYIEALHESALEHLADAVVRVNQLHDIAAGSSHDATFQEALGPYDEDTHLRHLIMYAAQFGASPESPEDGQANEMTELEGFAAKAKVVHGIAISRGEMAGTAIGGLQRIAQGVEDPKSAARECLERLRVPVGAGA